MVCATAVETAPIRQWQRVVPCIRLRPAELQPISGECCPTRGDSGRGRETGERAQFEDRRSVLRKRAIVGPDAAARVRVHIGSILLRRHVRFEEAK